MSGVHASGPRSPRVKRVRPYGTLIALALALGAITSMTVALVNHGAEHSACTILTPAGGAVIVMSVAVLLITGRALMRQVRHEADHADSMIARIACPECGRDVYGAWRMCPYCGAMVDKTQNSKNGEVTA